MYSIVIDSNTVYSKSIYYNACCLIELLHHHQTNTITMSILNHQLYTSIYTPYWLVSIATWNTYQTKIFCRYTNGNKKLKPDPSASIIPLIMIRGMSGTTNRLAIIPARLIDHINSINTGNTPIVAAIDGTRYQFRIAIIPWSAWRQTQLRNHEDRICCCFGECLSDVDSVIRGVKITKPITAAKLNKNPTSYTSR